MNIWNGFSVSYSGCQEMNFSVAVISCGSRLTIVGEESLLLRKIGEDMLWELF